MSKKPKWRLRLAIAGIIILIFIGLGLIWLLSKKGDDSWLSIVFVVSGCILAFLQWFVPIPPFTNSLDEATFPQVPPEIEKDLMDAQNPPKGKGAIIVPAAKEDLGQVFYLLDKHEVLTKQIPQRKPRSIAEAVVILHPKPYKKGRAFYAATFGSIDPGNYIVWKSVTGTPPINIDLADKTRWRGVGVVADKARIVPFSD